MSLLLEPGERESTGTVRRANRISEDEERKGVGGGGGGGVVEKLLRAGWTSERKSRDITRVQVQVYVQERERERERERKG